MSHIPQSTTTQINVLSFEEARNKAPKKLGYNEKEWIYIPKSYEEYRYVLGTTGKKPIICIGINPSTAKPGELDNTLKSVQRIALTNDYDSFIMFNIYPQRATNPDDIEIEVNTFLHHENMKAFKYILNLFGDNEIAIWAAWGENIEKCPYFIDCLRDIVDISCKHNTHWYWIKKRKWLAHPRHPLYLRSDEKLRDFNIRGYLDILS